MLRPRLRRNSLLGSHKFGVRMKDPLSFRTSTLHVRSLTLVRVESISWHHPMFQKRNNNNLRREGQAISSVAQPLRNSCSSSKFCKYSSESRCVGKKIDTVEGIETQKIEGGTGGDKREYGDE